MSLNLKSKIMTKQHTPDSQTGNMTDAQAASALKQHGGKIVWAIIIALSAYFGWQFYQKNYGKFDAVLADNYANISERNDALNLGLQNPDLDDTAKAELAKEQAALFTDIDALVAKHGNTAYAWQALMIKARHQADSEQYKDATATLQKAVVIDVGDEGLVAIARLRLAQVLLADGDLETALTTANTAMPPAFEPSRQELLGDIYLAKGETDSAKKAYELAWQALSERQEIRSLLSLKMQSLGMTPAPITPKPSVVEVPELPQVASQTVDVAATEAKPTEAKTDVASATTDANKKSETGDAGKTPDSKNDTGKSDVSATDGNKTDNKADSDKATQTP